MSTTLFTQNRIVILGERLALARRRAGLKQVELAVALGDGYDQTMISAVECGRSALRFAGLVRAAQELTVSIDYLAGLTDDPTPAAELTVRVAALERRGAGGQQQ